MTQQSRLGVWTPFWRGRARNKSLFNDDFFKFFDIPEIITIEDWGCGVCDFKNSISSERCIYIGLDGCDTGYQDKIVDLVNYKSQVDGIFMRHVLEHNYNWEQIFINLLSSFKVRAMIVFFTPFSDNGTHTLNGCVYRSTNKLGENVDIPDLSLDKKDIIKILDKFSNITWKLNENISFPQTAHQLEHVLFLYKNQ